MYPFSDWSTGIKAACERLVHPSVTELEERSRQERLLQVLLASAVLMALTAAQLSLIRFGAGVSVAAAPLVFGIGLMAPFALMATARRKAIEAAALVLGAMAVALLVAAGGGLASPFAFMALALVAESGWVARTQKALGYGAAAAAAALAAGAGLYSVLFAGVSAAPPSAWQWLIPLVYGATLAARIPLSGLAEAGQDKPAPHPSVEDVIGATVLCLNRSGEVIQASDTTQSLLGVGPEILLGSGLFDRVHLTDRIAYLEALADLKEGATARKVKLRLRMAAQPNTPMSVTYRPCIVDFAAGTDGETFTAVLRDDDVAADLQEAIAETKDAAKKAELTKDRLLASVSHELRTPLNAIVGFSDLLGNEMAGELSNDKQREYVELIRAAGDHLLSVVNAILDMSKLQSGSYTLETESFSFEEAVRLSLTMMAQQVQSKPVLLKADISENVGAIHCDRRAVQQVLVNLISNAVKFTPSGEVCVSARRMGDRLDFTVRDTGIGISAEDLERIGTPFMQVQNDYTRQFEGTGLGLALVKGLVERMGGGISIESSPGSGTRVHVSLPAGRADEEDEAFGSSAASGPEWNDEWMNDGLRKTA